MAWTQTESNQEVSKMTDNHTTEHSITACLGVVDWPVCDVYKLLIQQYSQKYQMAEMSFLFYMLI